MIRKTIAVLAIISVSAVTNASPVRYTYTGSIFDSVSGTFLPSDSAISGYFVVANELDPNAPLVSDNMLETLAWAFTDGTTTITDATVGYSLTSLNVGTFGGNIVEWTIGITQDDFNSGGLSQLQTNLSFEIDFAGTGSDSVFYCLTPGTGSSCDEFASGFLSTTGSSSNLGTWTAAPVPLPGALWLMLSAIAIGRGWLGRARTA